MELVDVTAEAVNRALDADNASDDQKLRARVVKRAVEESDFGAVMPKALQEVFAAGLNIGLRLGGI